MLYWLRMSGITKTIRKEWTICAEFLKRFGTTVKPKVKLKVEPKVELKM